jgi:hypothetical protein
MRALLVVLCLLAGCGGAGGSTSTSPPPPPPPPPPPAVAGTVSLLFMGNSHTSFHDVPNLVAALVRAARPGRAVEAVEAPGWMFLEDRVGDAATLALLQGRTWSYVVLQAQKYSSSGQFTYSTAEAESLVRMSRAAGAVPILFPEWPRRGVRETQRIHDLHLSIARATPACIAPVPQAWDLALGRHPDLPLHDADGNHAAAPGAFLAALVLATTITGARPDTLPTIEGIGVDAATQVLLRGIAAETVLAHAPRQWCPGDAPLP